MSHKLYDGTSAYKIDEYYEYAEKAKKRQDEEREQIKTRSGISRVKLLIAVSAVFVVAIAFLWANAALLETNSKITELTEELDDTKARNTQLAFDISSSVNLEEVESKAIEEYGMQKPESYQNVYVDVVQSDYTVVSNGEQSQEDFISKMVKKMKTFLTYIG